MVLSLKLVGGAVGFVATGVVGVMGLILTVVVSVVGVVLAGVVGVIVLGVAEVVGIGGSTSSVDVVLCVVKDSTCSAEVPLLWC